MRARGKGKGQAAACSLLLLTLSGCPTPIPEPGPAAPVDILDASFCGWEEWARPVEDYLAAGEEELGHDQFLRGVQALAVFEDRLWLGYGDANVNLGRVFPIEPRYWTDPEAPEAVSADFATDDEQISRYRVAGDVLMIPGVDATEDAWLGNAYTLWEGGDWLKSRTLDQGVHVHDVARAGDTLYACGSGSTPEEWDTSSISSLIWRSDDGGETFELHHKVPDPVSTGDARFTDLAVVDGVLHAFGYRTDPQFSIDDLIAFREAGDELEEVPGMGPFWVTDSIGLTDSAALAAGVYAGNPLHFETRLITGEGAEEWMDGRWVSALARVDAGRTLLLWAEGDDYPAPAAEELDFALGVSVGGEEPIELVELESEAQPLSAAWWRGSLFVGMDDGTVWRNRGDCGGE